MGNNRAFAEGRRAGTTKLCIREKTKTITDQRKTGGRCIIGLFSEGSLSMRVDLLAETILLAETMLLLFWFCLHSSWVSINCENGSGRSFAFFLFLNLDALKSSFYDQYEQLSMISMSLSNMSLSSIKKSNMSIEYEQGNQVPGLGALDNIDIPARRNKNCLI